MGNAGLGKTATVRYTVQKILENARARKMKMFADYRNCLVNRTSAAIFRGILRDKFSTNIRGLGTEEAIDALIRRLNAESGFLILILDEVTALTEQDIEHFLHLTDEFGGYQRFSLIMISRPTEWKTMLFPEISQRISDVINFEPYSKEAIFAILSYRAELALKPTAYNDELLEMIAAISASTQNLRHGIEILHRAGRIADRKGVSEIEPEMIREAKASVYPELREEMLSDLNKHELYTLLGITRCLLTNSYTAVTVQEAYASYRSVVEEYDEQALPSTTFLNFLENLENFGLISSICSRKGKVREGKRNRITINDVPAQVLQERIEHQLTKPSN